MGVSVITLPNAMDVVLLGEKVKVWINLILAIGEEETHRGYPTVGREEFAKR